MQAEAPPSPAPRRGNAGRLERALIALAGGEGRVLDHRERGWASITFAGTRHTLRIAFDTPEAIEGGPIAIVRTGDRISIDAETNEVKLEVNDEEIAARLAQWEKPAPRYTRGVLAKYAAMVTSASEGAVTDKHC